MELREPDSEFVLWLNKFDPYLRVRWNPQLQRWVIDERNRQNRCWGNILVWQDDDKNYLPINRDLCLRLELMRSKYNNLLVVGPDDYLRNLESKAQFIQNETLNHLRMDARGAILDDWKYLKNDLVKLVEQSTKI